MRVLFVTGTRADYSKQEELIKTTAINHKHIKVEIFCTGMHLRPELGNTHVQIDELAPIGVKIHKIENFCEKGMSQSFIETSKAFDSLLSSQHYDAVILHGDRLEPLACATIALIKGIKIIHLEGGELSGTIDEVIRHAISKMAHYHLVANKIAKKRLISMGENPKSIYLFGSLDIQIMLNRELPNLSDIANRYDITNEKFSLVLLHSVVTDPQETTSFAEILKAYIEARESHFFVIISPNTDNGSSAIAAIFSSIKSNNVKMIPSMRFDYYLGAMKKCHALIGNSSSGVREAPIYGIPVVNLGSRQLGRSSEYYEGVTNIQDPIRKDVFDSLDQLTSTLNRFPPLNEFGQYDSKKVFFEVMDDLKNDSLPLQKTFFE